MDGINCLAKGMFYSNSAISNRSAKHGDYGIAIQILKLRPMYKSELNSSRHRLFVGARAQNKYFP